MHNFQDFQGHKTILLQEYENLIASGILPLTCKGVEVSQASIARDIDALQQERFVVSICGQVKVGKSTILNAMLFEQDILPNSVTPETAKLTEISWGLTPSFQADFYSQDEWNTLKESVIEGENYYEKYISPMLASLRTKYGMLYPEKELAKVKYVGNDLAELKEYVGSEGRYTPFVKYCHIQYPSELLKEVIVVDTPGTNDPNLIRSRETENWIGKSDAVVFVMYAGQALTVQDKSFIENFLMPVPSDKILLALSKVDTVQNGTQVQQYVEKALRDMEGFRKLIANQKTYGISPICSLYPKLRSMHESGKTQLGPEILEDIEFQLDQRRAETASFVKADGYLPEFIAAVEERLLKNKGEGLIDSHRQKIIAVYERGIGNQTVKVSQLEEKLGLLASSEEELKTKRDKIELSKDKLAKLLEKWKRDMAEQEKELDTYLWEQIVDVLKQVQKRADENIENHQVKNYLEQNLAWDVKGYFEEELQGFSNRINDKYKQLADKLEDHKEELKTEVYDLNVFIPEMINEILRMPDIWQVGEAVEQKIMSRLSPQILKELHKSRFLFFTNQERTKGNYKASLRELCTGSGQLRDCVRNAFSPELAKISGAAEEVSTAFLKALQGVSESLSEVVKGLISKGDGRKKIEEEITQIKRERSKYEKMLQMARDRLNT